jgi:hypothetical protein
LELLGYLVQPVCLLGAQHPVFLLVVDPSLRDYIYLSQTFPSRLPPLSPGSATWSLTNLTDPSSSSPISLTLTVPDQTDPVDYQVTQEGGGILLGVRPPVEYAITVSASGSVVGSLFVNIPPLAPPPFHLPLPPPPLPPPLSDGTFPPDYEYPPDFLWPSQVHTFYPWFYLLYGGSSLPALEFLPYVEVL